MAGFSVEFGRAGEEGDLRLDAPAFHRNHAPIWAVLEKFLRGKTGDVLEAGSGTGQHVVHFARQAPDVTWWPSDVGATNLRSILAWRAHAGLTNIERPLAIDLADPSWSPEMSEGRGPSKLLAVFCANVIHIAPWRVAEGLFAGAARYLGDDGRLFLYGPFKRGGHHTSVSNAVFDTRLRHDNPQWGVRDIADVEALAARNGFALRETVGMPASNLILEFARARV